MLSYASSYAIKLLVMIRCCNVAKQLNRGRPLPNLYFVKVCNEVGKPNKTRESVHLTCEITARPCCAGILGQCLMTTRDHCSFLKGYFHSEAQLCSQVCIMFLIGSLVVMCDGFEHSFCHWNPEHHGLLLCVRLICALNKLILLPYRIFLLNPTTCR